MIKRKYHVQTVENLLKKFPVVAIIGARQVGKTTLARQIATRFRNKVNWFDLENPEDLAHLTKPKLTLELMQGLIVIDEIQRRPELFPVLRVLIDNPHCKQRFLVLGSASGNLLRQSSESLAGRIAYHTISGFSLEEVGAKNLKTLWIRGSFPRSFLAKTNNDSYLWRREFTRTFLERDIPQFGIITPFTTMYRFWSMLAHYHGQIWNASEFGRSFGVADTTVRKYLDILSSTFIVRQLLPWHENISKRQIKSPKIYFHDSGLLHTLLGIKTLEELLRHPKIGASWEGFALEMVIQTLKIPSEECFFWATHSGAELDLLIVHGENRLGFEFKYTDMPKITPSLKIATTDLKLKKVYLIHAGQKSFPISHKIDAVALSDLVKILKTVGTWHTSSR